LDSLEVLFLGNSFISKNYLPAIFQSLSNAQGKHPHVDNYTPLGYTLQQHSEDSITLDKISMIDWDIIILQEQGQIPSYDPGRDTLMYPYAVMLDSFIHACHPCAKTLFFLTWANKNGDVDILQQGGTDSYDAMQQRLTDGYTEIADSTGATIIPVGAAWKTAREQFPDFELYDTGNILPSLYGSYLAGCVVFTAIYGESCTGNSYTGGVSDSDVLNIQEIASSTVLDSLERWNIGIYASFDYSCDSLTVFFNNNSCNSNLWTWNFGDMTEPSVDENPVHTYHDPGYYNVILVSTDSCLDISDSYSMTIEVTANSIPVQYMKPFIRCYPNPASTDVIVQLNEDNAGFILNVIDMLSNKVIITNNIGGENNFSVDISGLKQGVYMLRIEQGNSIYITRFIKLDTN
jgi:hypothetical protein